MRQRLKLRNDNLIRYSKQLAMRYPSNRFNAYGKCNKIEIPFGTSTELKVNDVKFGLAHLCEHIFGCVVFNKNICEFETAYINKNFTKHNISYNNDKEFKQIIVKLRKLIYNFNISDEQLIKEKEILKNELLTNYNARDAQETIRNLVIYGKIHSVYGTGKSLDSITKEDVINFIKKYYRYMSVDRDEQLFRHNYTRYINMKYYGALTKYNHSNLLVNKTYIEGDTHKLWIYGIHKGYSSIVTDMLQQVLYETRNRYDSFLANTTIKIDGEYKEVYFTVTDINFDTEKFKSKVLKKAKYLKNKQLKKKVLRFFNNDTYIYI